MRRLQLTAAVAALGIASIATSSSALTFLFYLLLLVVGGSWLVTRLVAAWPGGRLRRSTGRRPRSGTR